MAYKKYIKRGDKIYGPYIYHSKKINGRVTSEYLGKYEEKRINNKTPLLAIVISLVLLFSIFFMLKNNLNQQDISKTFQDIKGLFSKSFQSTGLVVSDTIVNNTEISKETFTKDFLSSYGLTGIRILNYTVNNISIDKTAYNNSDFILNSSFKSGKMEVKTWQHESLIRGPDILPLERFSDWRNTILMRPDLDIVGNMEQGTAYHLPEPRDRRAIAN